MCSINYAYFGDYQMSIPIMPRLPPNQKTLTRRELRNVVHQTLSQLSNKQAYKITDEFIEEILSALISGENVKLRGFGTFYILNKKERIGRNPKTLEDAVITLRKVVKFKAAPKLVAIINGTPYDETADNDPE